jgi:3-deoxy-manno-octulosonate cytidylyltransferase (CMP-KDO synthetase)
MQSKTHPKIYIAVPARYAATRLPGKPLAKILGQPMIQWVLEGLKNSPIKNSEIILATDHADILKIGQNLGIHSKMTSPELPSGTDRIFAALNDLQTPPNENDIIINVQGDEPTITSNVIQELVDIVLNDTSISMATLGHKLDLNDLDNINAVKVIVGGEQQAIYFSRFGIPFSKGKPTAILSQYVLKHIGIYAYKWSFLKSFIAQKPVEIELAEGLEQLRALHMNVKIKVGLSQFKPLSVDIPDDILKVERYFSNQ